MNFLKKAELTNQIVQELASCIVPSNWEKVIYYTERFQDEDLGLINGAIARCWTAPNSILYRSSTRPPLKDTFKLYDLIEELYKLSANTSEQWCGLGIRLTRDGKYSTKFYYEGLPLLNDDNVEQEKRFTEIDV